ncbi:cell envelope integrity protein TolA [Halopseudomonas sp.]|uniref:cell envelope integrity protein TolA n=1 Tax=Halopseudomonas sp. TaxID=2901191 RepID=UPI0039E4640E
MNTRDDQPQASSGSLAAPVLKALAVHLGVAMMLFVSFSSAPEFEPAKPIVQATLVQLNSKSPATTQTNQSIAGEAQKTAAPQHEAEELKQEQQKQEEAAAQAREERAAEAAAAAEAAKEQKQAQEQEQAKEQKEAEAEKAAAAAEARKADAAKKLAAEEAAKKKAADEAAKKQAAAEAAKKKAADEAKKKAAADAAKKAEADKAAQQRRDAEEAKARALAELLADETQYQQAQADEIGDEVAASFDDLIRRYVSEQWRRPPTARNGMVVEVVVSMLPTGQITDAVVARSSGDAGFDQSAVQAVRNVGRIPEMQQLSRDNPATFDRMYRKRTLRFKPEDLSF